MPRNLAHCIRGIAILLALTCAAFSANPSAVPADARLQKAYRFQQGGWTYVHLEGSPAEIGFQHGYLLAPEIADGLEAIKLFDTRETQRDWEFFRTTAREMLWPHIDAEYQQELQGIADGVKAHGVDLDVYDIVALNAFEEVPDYYVPWLNKQTTNKQTLNEQQKSQKAPKLAAPGNCSAFIATGSMTKDHQIVIAHNNWTSYLAGELSTPAAADDGDLFMTFISGPVCAAKGTYAEAGIRTASPSSCARARRCNTPTALMTTCALSRKVTTAATPTTG